MIACHVAGLKMGAVIKDTIIMLLPMLAVLGLVIIWPDVSLLLPKLISPEFLQ
jgi:TRAP-type C4-dicarboxylate transport system permease large subunit